MKALNTKKGVFLDMNYFNSNMELLNNLCSSNQDKTIHLKVELARGVSFNDLFDSFKNQVKKLIFLIEEIKYRIKDINIFLIGHSQGGLVNLSVASKIPLLIKEVISISTPYKDVLMAKNLLVMDLGLKLFSKGVFFEKDLAGTIRFQKAVGLLGSKLFFFFLKRKWYKTKHKPKLHVICGTSAIYLTTSVAVVKTNTHNKFFKKKLIPIYNKYPYDGLVLTSEQNAIKCQNIHNFIDPNIPCIGQKSFLNKKCSNSLSACNDICSLPKMHGVNTTIELAKDVFKGKDIYSLDLIKSMYEGVDQKPLTNLKYENYYNIFNNNYSHANIPHSDDVVALIHKILHQL